MSFDHEELLITVQFVSIDRASIRVTITLGFALILAVHKTNKQPFAIY